MEVTKKKFGTFAGVFTPTTLTILGVIMYIRMPWVVGNAGIIEAILILLISVTITFTTALSISSITTNGKIGAGGAFSVISQSLGLEIGGAIGIPFYLAQAIAVAMYVFGFREGLQLLLPHFSPLILDVLVFAFVMGVAFISTSFAFKIQYIILAIIVLSVFSIYGGLFTHELNYDFKWFGDYPGTPERNFKGTSFWGVFAVFFPAVTGVMAGANMSGDLKNPRVSIPVGTLSALIITSVIYFSLIFVVSMLATQDELVKDYYILLEKSFFPPLVLAGLLGATLSSALGSFVGAPRILFALGDKNILPGSHKISKLSKKGEPINAMIFTAIIALIGISLRDLNTIAPLLTMFFMITYAMVNVVALIEQALSLPSYRPSLKLPKIVPIIGALGSLSVMFVINPFVALVSIILILAFYFYLVKKNIKSVAGDSRSGLFTALAEWSTKKTTDLSPVKEARSWRPDLLLPVKYPKEIRTSFRLIESIVSPNGSIKILSLTQSQYYNRLNDFLPTVVKKFKEIHIPITVTKVTSENYNEVVNTGMQALNAAFFKPNTIFVNIDSELMDYAEYQALLKDVKQNNYGLIFYIPFGTANLSIEKNVHLWIDALPTKWKENFDFGHNDLAMLTSLLITKNWKGSIDLHISESVIEETDMKDLMNIIRFPKNTEHSFYANGIEENLDAESGADLHVFSITEKDDVREMVARVKRLRVSAIFCMDSGVENVSM